MTHPTPQGTRDILPDEMRELRRIERSLHELFEGRGYGEVSTPAIEFHDVLARGDERITSSAYRFFDPAGDLLALRSDMTIPIARLAADRLGDTEPPYRLHYVGNAYRAPNPQRGQMREFRQVGVELIGAGAPEGTAEVIELLVAALDAVGLGRAIVGLGDADLFRQLLDELGVEGVARDRILDRLAAHDLVAIEAEAGDLAGLGERERSLIVQLSSLRGGPQVIERAREIGGDAVARATSRLADTYDRLEQLGVGDRVQLDLGLLRDLGYYTGAILEVYDPAVGQILGGGGRYDGLMGRFGRELPAAGFALYLERVHIAQAEEERLAREGERGSGGR
jgi:ATP phosphoribosyltransferase regulatory subunit